MLLHNSQHSRSFLLLSLVIDSILLTAISILISSLIPDYFLVISILGWWILLLLTNGCQPNSLKFPKIVITTCAVGVGHLAFILLICMISQKIEYFLPLVKLMLLFYLFRIIIFTLLHRLYYYARNITDNMLRFVIIGDPEATTSKLLYNYLLRSEAKFIGYVDINSMIASKTFDPTELYKVLLSKRVSHIYCTLPLPQWKKLVELLKQRADEHFLYFHWLSDFSLEGSNKQYFNPKMKNNLIVYTLHKATYKSAS